MKRIIANLVVLLFLTSFIPVNAATISKIQISPAVTCVKIGETITFSATAFDEQGAPIIGLQFTWSVSGPGRILSKTDTTLTFGAITPGLLTITASSQNMSGSISFVVGSPKVRNVQVRVDPEIAGEVATYYLFFETDECGILSPGDRIYVAFPYGTIFPRSYYCGTLTVNGINASYEEVRENDRDTPILMIYVPSNFPTTTQIYIKICKVINPRGGACYMVAVATDLQPQWALSNSFAIRGSIITPPLVEVKPNIVGELASYSIKFKTSSSGRLGTCSGGYIMVEFPYGTKVPQTIKPEQVTINGVYCSSYEPLVNGRTVKLYPGMVVLEESDVEIIFTLDAGIQNPDTPGDFELVVWTSSDNVHVDSQTYRIVASKIENVMVTVDKPYMNTTSAYTIRFRTGLVGKMNVNGLITIYFPSTITLPKTSRPGDIKINGTATIRAAVVEGNYTLIIPLPVAIDAKSDVEIIVSETFGIINPPDPRKYYLEVHTAKEGTNVKSNEFMIGPSVIGDLSVNLKTPYIGISSQIDFSFKTGGGGRLLNDKDQIYIVFPKGTYIPNAIRAKDVLIQGLPLKTTPFLKKDTLEIILLSPVDIGSNSSVSVQFLESSGILNPKLPGDYLWQVATSREVSYIKSPLIRITESSVTDVKAILKAQAVKEFTDLLVTFRLGEAGGLKKGDKIYIFLEEGFEIPDSYIQGVFFNNQEIPQEDVLFDPIKISFTLQMNQEIDSGSEIQIVIKPESGIRNPGKTGEYSVGVSTSREVKTIKSNGIIVIPLPETDIKSNPSNPDGKNGWYSKDCEISFLVHTLDKERIKTFFSINEAPFIEYTSPFKLSSGDYSIQYYSALSESAKEKTKTSQFRIDTKEPILDGIDQIIYTNQNPYKLSMVLIESHFAYAEINGNRIESLIEGKIQFALDLKEGENDVSIIVTDLAGNETEKLLKIYYDHSPPKLEILEPLPWSKTIRKKITIRGNTEPNCKLTINDQNIPIETTGSFMHSFILKNGLNALSFISLDLAGNQTIYSLPVTFYPNFQVKLKIGKSVAESSFGNMELGANIYVEQGTTMVPLRVFTDLLGCKIQFEPVFQIITIEDPTGKVIKTQIGNKIFTVNQIKKTMPVAPSIRNGKTFIPIRFFAEEFGFIITYAKKEQTVILQYNEQ